VPCKVRWKKEKKMLYITVKGSLNNVYCKVCKISTKKIKNKKTESEIFEKKKTKIPKA